MAADTPYQSQNIKEDRWPVVERTIALPHSKVHAGQAYIITKVFEGVNDGANAELLLKLGPNKTHHTVINVVAEGNCFFKFFEGPTITDNGTAVSAINLNRFGSAADGTYFHTPTTSADGTQLLDAKINGGSGGNAVGGSGGSEHRGGAEFILRQNYNYLIRVTNDSGNSKDFAVSVTFYQEEKV